MKLASTAFEHGQPIPSKYTCDGDDVNPQLHISDIPEGTQSLALIMDDPDAPAGTANPGWVHWVVYNISPVTTDIAENSVPDGGTEGQNDFGNTGYGGPCPPSGEHRYFFRLYALDGVLDFAGDVAKADLERAIDGHALDQAELMGTYAKR